MSRKRTIDVNDPLMLKRAWIEHYWEKAENMFSAYYKVEEMTPEEWRFFVRRLFRKSRLSAWKLADDVYFTDFAPFDYNTYNYPTKATPIAPRITAQEASEIHEVGKDIFLLYATYGRKQGLFQILTPLIEELAEIQMSIRVNRKTISSPLIFRVLPEKADAFRELKIDLDNYEDAIAFQGDLNDVEALKRDTPDALQELEQLEGRVWNKILTILGIDNVGIFTEQRQGVDQVNANNQEITIWRDVLMSNIDPWFEDVNKLSSRKFKFEIRTPYEPVSVHEEINSKGEVVNKEKEETANA